MLQEMRSGGVTVEQLNLMKVAGMGAITVNAQEVCVELYVYKPPKNKFANMILQYLVNDGVVKLANTA